MPERSLPRVLQRRVAVVDDGAAAALHGDRRVGHGMLDELDTLHVVRCVVGDAGPGLERRAVSANFNVTDGVDQALREPAGRVAVGVDAEHCKGAAVDCRDQRRLATLTTEDAADAHEQFVGGFFADDTLDAVEVADAQHADGPRLNTADAGENRQRQVASAGQVRDRVGKLQRAVDLLPAGVTLTAFVRYQVG